MAAKVRLPPMPPVSQILKIYNVHATKQLAQNFLFDPRIVSRIVSCMGPDLPSKHVCEVGPGPGGITRKILERGVKSLTVVEKDRRFIPSLQMLGDASGGRMRVHHGDILTYDKMLPFPQEEAQEWQENCPNLAFIGNLPFNVSLPLLFQFLNDVSHRDNVFSLGRIPMIFTFQHEVAERLVSLPGDLQRCRLSITAQYLCNVRYVFQIKGRSFVPPPKVDVGVVNLTPKKEFEINLPFKTVDHVVKHIFHFRQKKCERGIQTLFPPQRDDLSQEMIQKSGVNRELKPTELYMKHFRDLCYAYEEICARIPHIASVDTYGKKEWLKYFDGSGELLCADASGSDQHFVKQAEDFDSSCVI